MKGDSTKPGAKVIVYPDKGDLADKQLWYEDEKGVIRSKLSGFALDASGNFILPSLVFVFFLPLVVSSSSSSSFSFFFVLLLVVYSQRVFFFCP